MSCYLRVRVITQAWVFVEAGLEESKKRGEEAFSQKRPLFRIAKHRFLQFRVIDCERGKRERRFT